MKESFFYTCSTVTLTDNDGSGAIWIYGIQQELSVSKNIFISCTSTSSGGAFIVKDCLNNVKGPDVINNCRYIDCNVTDQTPDGGAVWIWKNNALIGLSDCLFSLCNSGYIAGALRHNLDPYSPGSYPIRYCFFNKNISPSGNDVFFPSLPSDAPCLHCFSTTSENRISYFIAGIPCNTDQNWLP